MAESPDGSEKWRTSDWQALLRSALTLIDTIEGNVPWSFGGGTALAVQLAHRISYDIDIFIPNADAVTELSPHANPATRALLGGRKYEFPGSYLKLKLDAGEIDFIVGGKRTTDPSRPWRFEDRDILIETPWEIAIKKLFYRPSTFKVRDIFDLAAIIETQAEKLSPYVPVVADKLDKAIDRISLVLPSYEERALNDVNSTELGRKYATKAAAQSVLDFLIEHQPKQI
ncbi:nucleotidyl transferase AbiEii/AbiGii toxin family protein [Dongia sp.]|uniref:nucleotidyl transferase AbiEii/AbiGii toxin family protein n=1 Tax=Dongia sp. TaxID=1977262 RepID=UPI0037504405